MEAEKMPHFITIVTNSTILQEILITAGGENVAPVLIEQAVQSELLHIGYAVLIGDQRKFLSVLLTLKVSFILSISCSRLT